MVATSGFELACGFAFVKRSDDVVDLILAHFLANCQQGQRICALQPSPSAGEGSRSGKAHKQHGSHGKQRGFAGSKPIDETVDYHAAHFVAVDFA